MCCGERMLAMDSWSVQRGGLGLVLMLVGQDVGRAARPSDPQIRYRGTALDCGWLDASAHSGEGRRQDSRVELPSPTSTLHGCVQSGVRCRASAGAC